MPRHTYNRKNEPKERDKTAKIKRGHALNNDSITKACNQWLKSRDNPNQPPPAPCTLPRIIKTHGRSRINPDPPPSMHAMIMADRWAHIVAKMEKQATTRHTPPPSTEPVVAIDFQEQQPRLQTRQKPAHGHSGRNQMRPPTKESFTKAEMSDAQRRS